MDLFTVNPLIYHILEHVTDDIVVDYYYLIQISKENQHYLKD